MFKGFLIMNIEEIKKEYKKIRMPKMDISINDFKNFDDFVQRIKKQDLEDEKYILQNKMIPVSFGLFFVLIIMLFNPIKSTILLTGVFLIFLGLISTLILLFIDYRNISKESYDLSLLAFLKNKKERLKSWRLTSAKYYLTFIVFVSGLIMLNISLLKKFSTEFGLLFLIFYIAILAIAWIIGEHFYRKRHREKHEPLLKIISEQINELNKE